MKHSFTDMTNKNHGESILIAICGMAGSGKTEAKNYFVQKSFEPIKFGVTEYVLKKHGYTTEKLERTERNNLRTEYGMGVFASMAKDRISELMHSGKNVVIENMYSWSEYKILSKEFGNRFVSLAILASPETRYQRLAERSQHDGRKSYLDKSISIARDYSEIEEIEKGGPIAMSHYYVINDSSLEDLYMDLEKVYKKIASFRIK